MELVPTNEHEAQHAPDHSAFWLDVYRLLTHCLASERIAAIPRPGRRGLRSYDRSEIFRLLINLASCYRVKYDDGSWVHVSYLQGEHEGVGRLHPDETRSEDQRLEFRDACNKIIHANRLHFDGDVNEATGIEYINPKIYLYGEKSGKAWRATLDVVEFCKAANSIIV